MAEASFKVKYDGPALRDGRIPVSDLAPALLALGDVFREAAAELYPDLPPPTLEVEAPERGSFSASLILQAADAWEQSIDMFSSKEASALANLLQIATASGTGIFFLIRRLRGRRIRKVENTDDPDAVAVTLDDGEEFIAAAKTVKVSRNPKVRRAAREVVDPVKRQGISKVEIGPKEDADDEAVVIESEDAGAFDLPIQEDGVEEIVDNFREALVKIVKTDFEDGRWKVNDGSSTFGVELEDEGFKDQIDRRAIRFGSGDMLRCKIRTSQWVAKGKLRSVHYVTEVIEHIEAEQQLKLDNDREE